MADFRMEALLGEWLLEATCAAMRRRPFRGQNCACHEQNRSGVQSSLTIQHLQGLPAIDDGHVRVKQDQIRG